MADSSTTATARLRQAAGRPWRSAARISARTPLRVKLIAALLTLVIAGLAATSITGAFVLRDYLEGRADTEVTSAYNHILHESGGQSIPGTQAGGLFSGSVSFPYVTQLRNSRGQLVLGNESVEQPPAGMPKIPTSQAWLRANEGSLATVGAVSATNKWRVITRQVTVQQFNAITGQPINLTYTLVVGVDLGDVDQTIGRLVSIDLIVGVIVVLALAIVGVALVRASLQSLAEIEQTAGEIAAGDLSRRVPDHDPRTEVGSLGQSLNAMLAQIEGAFRAQAQSEATARWSEGRMRQFVADASHELRTPLTTIRGFAEYYRQRNGPAANGNSELSREDLDRIMHRVEGEAARMGVLVEDLLLLARIDQQRPLEWRPVDLLVLAADAVQDARMIAPNREVRLTVGRDTAFLVHGDEARLRQVVGNLMNNALTHTPDGTLVEVHVHSGLLGGANQAIPAVVLDVIDHGPGLSSEQAQRVFERFYRADQARTRKTGGTGLGLAIVSALVAAHGGAVSVDSEPGRGATFRVALPLAADAQDDDEEGPGGQGAPGGQADWLRPAGQGAPTPGEAARASGETADIAEQRPWRPFSLWGRIVVAGTTRILPHN